MSGPTDAVSAEAATTRDRLLDGRVQIDQPADGYRVAIDPVLLAAAVPARNGDRVLDLGAGVGAASLCLATRVAGCRVTGLEVQPDIVALARANVALNDLTSRVTIETGTIAGPPPSLGAEYDCVMLNPPYLPMHRAEPSGRDDRARVEREPLPAWLGCAVRLVRPKGVIAIIHRADRVDEVISGLTAEVGGIEILPIWPKAGQDARRVIVRGRRGVASPARLAAGLVLHGDDGAYTPEAEAILRDGAALAG